MPSMWEDDDDGNYYGQSTVTDEMVERAIRAYDGAGGYPDDHPYESLASVKMRAALEAAYRK